MFACPRRMLLAIALAGWPLVAGAQQPRYVPPMGGTPPSALNLFRFDSRSPRDYDGLTLRTQELGNQTQQLGNQFQSLSANQKADRRATEKSLLQLRNPDVAPTGVQGHFRDYSHYYPQYPTSGGVRALRR